MAGSPASTANRRTDLATVRQARVRGRAPEARRDKQTFDRADARSKKRATNPFYHAERHKVTLTAIQEKLDEAEFVEGCEKGKLGRDEAVALSLGGVKPDA